MVTSGETLRLLRQLKGCKQETIAKKLGITQPAYCHLENKQYVDRDKFEKIVACLGYSGEELKAVLGTLPSR